MFRIFAAFCLSACLLTPCRADDQGLQRFVDEQTILVGSLDIRKAGLEAIYEKILPPVSKEQTARNREQNRKIQQAFQELDVQAVLARG